MPPSSLRPSTSSSDGPPSGDATEILLLRHAPTAWNEEHRQQGSSDQPLSPAGRHSALEWAGPSRGRFTALACSDLARARQTAELIGEAVGLREILVFAGLREQDLGQWTGLTKEQIRQRWPERSRERPRRPVGGETPAALFARVFSALAELGRRVPRGPVLAISHSGVIRSLELRLGAEAPPVPYLEGRWLRVHAPAAPAASDPARTVAIGATTAGRPAGSGESVHGRAGGRGTP